jgi:hypothetical protein
MVKRKFGASVRAVRAKTFPAQVNETLHWTAKTGNGSLYTTARDLLAFHHALQRGLVLRPETVVAAHGFDRADRKVGMFWFHHVVAGHRAVYVGGSSPGFKAHLERFIDDDTCVIVLSNIYVAAATPIANSPRRCSLVRLVNTGDDPVEVSVWNTTRQAHHVVELAPRSMLRRYPKGGAENALTVPLSNAIGELLERRRRDPRHARGGCA